VSRVPLPLRHARALMARLSYTRKILVVVLVMALPLGYTMAMYLEAQGGQVDFAAQERLGVEYLVPLSSLAEEVVAARHDPTSDITRRIEAIRADSEATVQALTDIAGVIARVNEVQATIATAVGRQGAAMAVLGRDVAGVASAAAEVNTGIGHVESAADDSEQRAREVSSVAADLERSAGALRDAVRRFSL
jgi:hypothetical protein